MSHLYQGVNLPYSEFLSHVLSKLDVQAAFSDVTLVLED